MMPLPPNPPAQLLEGVGPAGEEGRGGACDTEQPSQLGRVQVRGPGWGPGPAGQARERQPQVGRRAGPGGIGKNRDGGERAVGVQEGEASFQRRKGEEPPLEQRHVQVAKERDGTLDSDLPPQRVTQTLIPTTQSPLITDH